MVSASGTGRTTGEKKPYEDGERAKQGALDDFHARGVPWPIEISNDVVFQFPDRWADAKM